MRSEKANLRFERAKIRPESADLRPNGQGGMYGQMEGWTSGNSSLCPTGHRPLGAATHRGNNDIKITNECGWTRAVA